MTPKDPKDTMRDFWDAKARENAMYYISSYRDYDDQDPLEFWKWGRKLAEQFLDASGLEFTGDEVVLEIGCGMGRMTDYFAERFARVYGIDVSEEMIALAKTHLSDRWNVELHATDGKDLSIFDDACLDLVFSYIVLQHIPDPAISLNYIREAGRVLRPGGHFLFQVNTTPYSLRERLGRVKRAVKRLAGRRAAEGPATAPEPDPGVESTRDPLSASGPADEASAGPRGLDNPAWVGSRLSHRDVERAVADGGMRIVSARDVGTQYTWYVAQR